MNVFIFITSKFTIRVELLYNCYGGELSARVVSNRKINKPIIIKKSVQVDLIYNIVQ